MEDLETVPVPAGLRPGQLGVVMIGHVVMGDIAVTLLKGLKNGPGESVLGGVLLPYALRFGLISRTRCPWPGSLGHGYKPAQACLAGAQNTSRASSTTTPFSGRASTP